MVTEPTRETPTKPETAQKRRGRRVGALLQGGATLLAALVLLALRGPKLPPSSSE